jgi:endonuclease/exonuclease/phosphatase family metal-dependent hydrolase
MQIKLISLNTWLLPFVSQDQRERKKNIVTFIKKTNPDIICLQEVWLKRDIRYFRKNLPEYHCHHGNHVIFNRSGLVTFSKLPVLGGSFEKFPANYHPWFEYLGGKGVLKSRISLGDTSFDIWNTHLYTPRNGDQYIAGRQLSSLVKNSPERSLIVGDLNLPAKTVKGLRGKCRIISPMRHTYSFENRYTCYMMKTFDHIYKLTMPVRDYVLLNSGKSNASFKSDVISNPILSDHYAISTTLIIPQ